MDKRMKFVLVIGFIVAMFAFFSEEQFNEVAYEEADIVSVMTEYRQQEPLYDVPLSAEVQRYIFNVCSYYNLEPSLVIAVIECESGYDEMAIGDGGESYGLMQVQPRWHMARMDRLGVTDLFNPYENISVGVDILAECVAKYDDDIGAALTAYNSGCYKGEVTKYARSVLEIKEKIEGECI